MGFLDKVKASAEQAIAQGQGKLDEVQAKKKADGLLKDLGSGHYAIETGRDEGEGPDHIARITGELQAHEAANGQIPVGPAAEPPPAPPMPPAPPAAGPPPPPGSVPPPPPGVMPPPPPGAVPPPPGAVPPPPPPGSGAF